MFVLETEWLITSERVGYKTPLQYANKPNMDKLASSGELGLVNTVP